MVLKGAIRVVKTAVNGRELQLYKVESGESCVITSSCLLGNSHYPARGVTQGELEAIMIPKPLFDELLERHPGFRLFVFQLFSERMSSLMQLIEEVAFRKLNQRLAALILAKSPHGDAISTTHQKLADELGSKKVSAYFRKR